MSTPDHGSRDHATWSASATARNVRCPGALALSALAPPDKESIHSARGTAAHQIAEKCLRGGTDPAGYLGMIEKTKEHDIEIDEEIVESVAMYVEYVRSLEAAGGVIAIEQKFSLSALKTPLDAGGTADAVAWLPAEKTLEVVDLKHGVGTVEADENPQLLTYAVGALLAARDLDAEQVRVTIVQPRAYHETGRVRSFTIHVTDLMLWTGWLLKAMQRSADAIAERKVVVGELSEQAWAEKWLNPGKCKWCPAEGFCPALRRRALDVVGLLFDDDDKPTIANQPAGGSPEAVARDLDALDMVEDWVRARRAYAHAMAERGETVPGYQLVEKHGRRSWAAGDDIVVKDLRLIGMTDADIYAEPKVKSPAQIEKVLGAKGKHRIKVMWRTPVTGTNLVKADETTKPPAKTAVGLLFDKE